jgi:hypothetical protein
MGFISEGVPSSRLRNCSFYLLKKAFWVGGLGPRKYCKESCCVVSKYVVRLDSQSMFYSTWAYNRQGRSISSPELVWEF